MAMNIADGAANALDGLKSRLGFGRKDDEFYDDDYDEFEEYGDNYDDNSNNYNDDAPVGGYRPITSSSRSSRSSRFGHGDSAADNLVSINDVKEHTRIPDRLQRDPLASSESRSSRRFDSSSASSAPSTPSRSTRAEGYDSLFESTDTPTFTPYDPYEAYSSSTPTSYSSARPLTVIKPVVYGDVERVARAVKSGDVVVLVMRNTPDDLSKRILDFSFGVASALDANVECPGDQVFAIARGNALTEDEKTRLRNQGAL